MSERVAPSGGEPLTGPGRAPHQLELDDEQDPLDLFERWFDAARDDGVELPEATALATATPEGRPSVRMVLLKGMDDQGFTFFTNYGSRKASELDANPHASLCFHWKEQDRQVRIEGPVARVSEEESHSYFSTRPEGSKIGAWASDQSRPLASRAELEQRVRDVRRRFEETEIPLPPHWGGYRLTPQRIEFWQGRDDRLHDRIVFERVGAEWRTVRLYP
ncbi:MAG: pyridoxamine 5'-phosphate oxidase [Gemmatimonadota bacterium]|nr:pyridoxamine 5'-phosphate oxidase [Gemmatimonadota bacterium]